MKYKEIIPPREFEVGLDKEKIIISDCAKVQLEPDEQVTFTTSSGGEYDVTRKSFGFYATPSLNGRLKKFNLRSALVKNRLDQYFILLVEVGNERLFEDYIEMEKQEIVCWLDDSTNLEKINDLFKGQSG